MGENQSQNELLAALEATLNASPENDVVRSHYVDLLVDSSMWQTVLDQCEVLLERIPSDQRSAERALMAAQQLEDVELVRRYRKMLSQLQSGLDDGVLRDAEQREAVPLRVQGIPDEYDKLLEQIIEESEEEKRNRITLDDVGGLENVKKRLRTSFLGPMKNPALREMYGKSLRGGLLLYGPPGCGKTHVARAIAGELSAKFLNVGVNDVLDMWIGNSEKNLHEIFETARRHSPTVLFLDELDAIGQKRSTAGGGAMRGVIAQLLTELDGITSDNDGVFVLGATNQPWDVDSALRRPGRFDRTLLVLPPDEQARRAIVENILKDKPVDKVDAKKIAKLTERFSGADLRLLCETAVERAIEESMETGNARPLNDSDFAAALRELRPSTADWFVTAKNYALFANQGGQFDELLEYMRVNKLG